MSDMLHMKALSELLRAPQPKNGEEAKAYLRAEQSFHEGKFQECLDALATIKKDKS